jgi:ribosome biogenesis GTPase A
MRELQADNTELWSQVDRNQERLDLGRQQQLEAEEQEEDLSNFELPDIVREKMANPNKALTADESIDVLVACIKGGMCEAKRAQGRELLMVIGNTGCGKSTFINYLHGCTMEKIKKQGQKLIVVSTHSPVKALTTIGHTNVSETFIPVLQQGSAFTYLDCPGFLDNRGTEINVANAVNIKNAVVKAHAVRVVVLINYPSLMVDRGKGVRDTLKVLIDLFGDIECLTKNERSILLGISKTRKASVYLPIECVLLL